MPAILISLTQLSVSSQFLADVNPNDVVGRGVVIRPPAANVFVAFAVGGHPTTLARRPVSESMSHPTRRLVQQLLNHRLDPPPDRQAVQFADVEHPVSADGGPDRCIGAELLGAAADVEVGGHVCRYTDINDNPADSLAYLGELTISFIVEIPL